MVNETKIKNKSPKTSNSKTTVNEDVKKAKVMDFVNFYPNDSGSSKGSKKCKAKITPSKSSSLSINTADLEPDLLTSTPVIKSIMKNKPEIIPDENGIVDYSVFKSKKRNKSVSFNLDDDNSADIKKRKSDEVGNNITDGNKAHKKEEVSSVTDAIKLAKVNKKKIKAEKIINNEIKSLSKKQKKKSSHLDDKEVNKENKLDIEVKEPDNIGDSIIKKNKKSKKHIVTDNNLDQPIDRPDEITEDLESLNIGDNPHTITDLLDEMTVAGKKNKSRANKDKIKIGKNKNKTETSNDSEGNETTKWNKRKWNKDKKGDIDEETNYAVVIGNLPVKMLLDFKKLLADHFSSLGMIKKIGVAEFYPAQDPNPVFSTTVHFHSEDTLNKALSANSLKLRGSTLRVSRLLPVKQTTAVLRTFGNLSQAAVSSALAHLGPIRNIRLLTKGRNSIGTAFVEYDGPESVARAITEGSSTKIGGKKIHIAKYEPRKRDSKRDLVTSAKDDAPSANESDFESYSEN